MNDNQSSTMSVAADPALTPPPQKAVTLETILEAWHTATQRLEKTHQALRSEVQRLSDELEIKNRQLARKNRLADLGQMASHVAHEVRNCLVPVTLYLSLLRRRLGNHSDNLDVMDKIESGFTALEAIVNDLLHFTSEREPQYQNFNSGDLIEEICASLAPQLAAQQIVTEIEAPLGLMIYADREMLRRAIFNLMLNALDVMPQGGELSITACSSQAGIEIEVADSGPGVSEEVRERVFEPFYTTKSGGTGLGLAIVFRIAQVHRGDVLLRNCAQGGAAFTLRIPREAQEKAA